MKNKRIRRIHNLRNGYNNAAKINFQTVSNSEPYAICYYLLNMFYDMNNIEILQEFSAACELFFKCIKKLDKINHLSEILNHEIRKLEKYKRLTPLKNTSHAGAFDGCIPFRYEQDIEIEQNTMCLKFRDELFVNLCRVLIASEKPVFSAIINTTLFNANDSYDLTNNISMSEDTKRLVFDISKTKFLVDQVSVSEAEARYLLLQFRIENYTDLKAIFEISTDAEKIFSEQFHKMIGVSKNELKYMQRRNSKLKEFGFLYDSGEYNEALNECIEEQSIEPYFSDILKPLDCSNAYDLESFSVNKDSLDISLDLLNGKKPVSLLFYGKPGSGKTELAKSLCKKTNRHIYIFKNETESERTNNILGQLVCLLSIGRPDSIIIVDEADSILKTLDFTFAGYEPNFKKGTINKMLENNKDKVIYIINHHHQIDDSTLRRFTFSIKFEAMPQTMLRSIAERKIHPLNISDKTKAKILDMMDKYKLTGTSAENIANVIESLSQQDEESILKKVQLVMKENSLLLYGKSKMRESACKQYDLSIINASINPNKIVEMVKNAQKFSADHNDQDTGIRMLFYGLSGSGKTEFARFIAECLNKSIILKRPSDILSKYVGETEQNIRTTFEEAEQTNSILLLDEADSFFQNRENAKNNWDITQVNELLTQMEEFSGILICTTNLRNIMDPAMQRRFHILAEFKALLEDGIKTLCGKYFPELDFSNEQIHQISKHKTVTPGDFAILHSRFRFMNSEEQTSEIITMELENIQKEKLKNMNTEFKIGFAAA